MALNDCSFSFILAIILCLCLDTSLVWRRAMEEWQREVGTTSFGRHVDRAIFQERSWNLGPNNYRHVTVGEGDPSPSVNTNRTLTSPIYFWSQQTQKTGGRKTSPQNEEKKTENVLRRRLINANRLRSTLSHHCCEIYESTWGRKGGRN
jgi:hypothetical protein